MSMEELFINMKITEQVNENSKGIDLKTTEDILRTINNEDKLIPFVVEKAINQIVPLVDEVVRSFNEDGRLFYIGAGTSGRLGVLDASECPPTFGVSENMVIGLIAGGDVALRKALENVEDNVDGGILDLKKRNFCSKDILVGIAASGSTPLVHGAMEYARTLGAVTGAIACTEDAAIFEVADYPILANVGPEIITGSTRMKAGTAEKLILNMITTSSMIKIGKVYDNYMVDMVPANIKLRKRAIYLVSTIAECDEELAKRNLIKTDYDVKISIVMIKKNVDSILAEEILKKAKGNLHRALGEWK